MRLPPTTDSEDQWVEILRALWPELATYVRCRLRTHEQYLVEDFMHEAAADFTTAWREKGRVPLDRAIAMVKQAARGDISNHRAKQARRKTEPYAVDDEVLIEHADPDSDNEILAAIGRIDHQRLIEQLPRLLNERHREAIVAVDVDGLRPGEAAAQLNISVPRLRSLRKEALGRLRHYLTTTSSSPSQTHRAHITNREIPS